MKEIIYKIIIILLLFILFPFVWQAYINENNNKNYDINDIKETYFGLGYSVGRCSEHIEHYNIYFDLLNHNQEVNVGDVKVTFNYFYMKGKEKYKELIQGDKE